MSKFFNYQKIYLCSFVSVCAAYNISLVLADSKATQSNQEKHEDPPFSEMDFTSTVIMPDEYSVSKLPLQTKQASPVGESDGGKGKTVLKEQTVVPPTKKVSSKH